MSVTFAIAIYVVIWWTVLFAVLPIGVRTQGEDGASCPARRRARRRAPRLLRVVLLTTLVSALVFARAVGRDRATASSISDAAGCGRELSQQCAEPQKRKEQGHRPCSRYSRIFSSTLTRSLRQALVAEFLPQTWAPKPLHNERSL